MIVAKDIKKVRTVLSKLQKTKAKIGLVPTMGALHKGHISLIKKAKLESDFLVASIFINPLQFGPKEDYRKYLRKPKEDQRLLKAEKVDLLFYPSKTLMYQADFSTYINEESLSKVICGKSRPKHFQGVCTVVAKLFNIVQPDFAYFGQKDYQQALIIKTMVKDLNFPIKVKILPIVRAKDGLAMSSRNSYLTTQQRRDAVVLFKALKLAKALINKGERRPKQVVGRMRSLIRAKKRLKIDYLNILAAEDLKKIKKIKGRVLIALAAYLGKTRLIDNIILNVKT
jgi:pantoate--beta-alanine ligase